MVNDIESKLREGFVDITHYLDFHSVVDGFRDTCLINILHDVKDFNKQNKTNIPEFEERIKLIETYLKELKPDYSLIYGWADLFFLTKKENINKIAKFLKKYEYNPTVHSTWSEKELGLILGYNECCVDAALRGDGVLKEGFRLIPINPCSNDCKNKWNKEYEKLAKKYNVDIAEEKSKFS